MKRTLLIFLLASSAAWGQVKIENLSNYPVYVARSDVYECVTIASMALPISGPTQADLGHLKIRDGKAVFDLPIEAPNCKKLGEKNPYGMPLESGDLYRIEGLKASVYQVLQEQLGGIIVQQEVTKNYTTQEHRITKRIVEFPGQEENFYLFDWSFPVAGWFLFWTTKLLLWVYATYLTGYNLGTQRKG